MPSVHAVTAVDLHLAVAVHPRHAEHDDPFGLDHPLEDFRLPVFGVLVNERPNRLGHFAHRLMEFGLGRTAGHQRRQEIRHLVCHT